MFLKSLLKENTQKNLHFFFYSILASILLAVLIQFVGRIAIVLSFALCAFFEISTIEKLNFFILSLRFDLKIATFAYVLPLVVGIPFIFTRFFNFYKKFFHIYSYIILLVLIIFCVVNYFYFKTYDKSIDTFIFALTKEDPEAIFETIVKDYPFFTGMFCLFIGLFVLAFLYKYLVKLFTKITYSPKYIYTASLFLTVFVSVFGMLMRGSFGTFPLRQLDAQVCDKPAINYSLASGVLSFYWAYQWEKESSKIPNVDAEVVAAFEEILGFKVNKKEPLSILKPLYNKTDKNEFLENNKPDIVFNVMESMSTHMLTYDDEKTRDLLGELRSHTKDDIFLTNFVSEGDGTSDSLTRLLVSVPDLNLSTSKYADSNYICNIVKIFKDAGYETVFVTASTASWRNYNNFLLYLGFDRVIERSHVKLKHPNATESAWGIDDEYMFLETYDVLKQKHDKPLFVMTLSITNHPPYRYPENKKMPDLNITQDILDRFPYADTKTIFGTFTYANNELGKFISKVKNDSSLAGKTVIAATGDHNLRGIGYLDHPEQTMFGHAVPFYLYLPEAYKKATNISVNKDRLGSHKDIITTILYHTQSNLEFYSFGCDLLSDRKCNFPFAYNQQVSAYKDRDYACSMSLDSKVKAYKFTNDGILYVDNKPSDGKCDYHLGYRMLLANLYYLQTRIDKKSNLIEHLKSLKELDYSKYKNLND